MPTRSSLTIDRAGSSCHFIETKGQKNRFAPSAVKSGNWGQRASALSLGHRIDSLGGKLGDRGGWTDGHGRPASAARAARAVHAAGVCSRSSSRDPAGSSPGALRLREYQRALRRDRRHRLGVQRRRRGLLDAVCRRSGAARRAVRRRDTEAAAGRLGKRVARPARLLRGGGHSRERARPALSPSARRHCVRVCESSRPVRLLLLTVTANTLLCRRTCSRC
jgi:hypothetical protein